jgi:hypothetical protein
MATKKSGTKKTARMVAENMPPMTPVPMAFWPPEPAPEEMANGMTPRMNASEVMRIGRNRWCAAFTVASVSSMPPS